MYGLQLGGDDVDHILLLLVTAKQSPLLDKRGQTLSFKVCV